MLLDGCLSCKTRTAVMSVGDSSSPYGAIPKEALKFGAGSGQSQRQHSLCRYGFWCRISYNKHAKSQSITSLFVRTECISLGISGALFGSIIGTLRSAHPVLFTVASGIQWFGIGAVFFGIYSELSTPSARVADQAKAQGVFF